MMATTSTIAGRDRPNMASRSRASSRRNSPAFGAELTSSVTAWPRIRDR